MSAPDLHLLSQSFIAHLLNGSALGLGVASVAWLSISMLGRKSAGMRFALCFATLLAIAVLSFVTVPAAVGHATHAASSALALPSSWAVFLFALWAVGVAFGLARIAVGLREVSRLRRRSEVIDIGTLDPTVQKTLKQFAFARQVTFRVSDDLQVPTALGFVNPAVLIPAWALRDLSAAELNAVLTHELAHLNRWDDWTKLAEKLIGALLFFHPAVWWIQSRLSLDREIACDDLVLSSSTDARGYAECLVAVAEHSRMRCGLALALAAISRVRQTSIRIAQILDPHRSTAVPTRAWKSAVAMATVLSAATLAGAPHVPTLVSFHDNAVHANASATRLGSAHVTPAKYTPAPARAVPATLELRTQSESSTIPARPTAKPVRKINRSHIVLTTARSRSSQQPGAVRASFAEQSVQAPAVLVIFTSQQFDDSGSLSVTMCVWKFTPTQKNATASQGIASKSI